MRPGHAVEQPAVAGPVEVEAERALQPQGQKRPGTPIVAMNAKASMTPPNWASTLEAESIAVRRKPSGRVPSSAKQTIAPTRRRGGR